MRLIDESEIPGKLKKKGGEWLKMFLKIPRGKAWAITEEEAGVKATSIKTMVNRLINMGQLPKNYKAIQRTAGGKVTVYIINSTEDMEDKTEKGVKLTKSYKVVPHEQQQGIWSEEKTS